MINSEKLRTAAWLLTKRPGIPQRIRLYLAFRKENRLWGETFDWSNRVRNALACPDNIFIPRVADAGKIDQGQLIMHNGLRVHELSYDGEGPRDLMRKNGGVHEPQEERLFMEVLKYLPSGSTMLEFGSYWAFYSMWFYRDVPEARCFCVEPASRNIQMGKDNFSLNFGAAPPRVMFEQAFAGPTDKAPSIKGEAPTVSVDGFLSKHGISHLAMLHADTQGHELDVLYGAARSLSSAAIDYVFLSTHTNELHRLCLEELRGHRYRILADVDLLETYSFDGLIVGQNPRLSAGPFCRLSLRGY
jgi:FkbM family methyltransferase